MEAEDYTNSLKTTGIAFVSNPYTGTSSAAGTITTTTTYPYYPYTYSEAKPSKRDTFKKMLWEVESEKRLKLILTKLKEDKLTVDEAAQIIQGDRAIDIDG